MKIGKVEQKQTPFLKEYIQEYPDQVGEWFVVDAFIFSEKGIFITTQKDAFNVFIFKGQSLYKTLAREIHTTAPKIGRVYPIGILIEDEQGSFEISHDYGKTATMECRETKSGNDMFSYNHTSKITKRDKGLLIEAHKDMDTSMQ